MRMVKTCLILFCILCIAACSSTSSGAPAGASAAPTQAFMSSPAPTQAGPEASDARETQPVAANPTEAGPAGTPEGAQSAAPAASPSPDKAASSVPETAQPPPPIDWQEMPVIPEAGESVKQIYQRGLELGNNPNAFSKIGDCGSTPAWFLGDFDRGARYYQLGPYQELEQVIQEFQGSFDRTSLAAKSGFNASSIFTPLWADRSQCESNEAPLACEYRVNRPIMAFIMLGTNDVYHLDTFEPQMRKIIEFSIEKGVIPILSTKADNLERDGSVNATIARLALEYGIPMWNYWSAMQSLPDQGLQPDQVHITWAPNRFNDPQAMERGWPVRNLTALQTLDAVWRMAANPD
jgi:hypothetical protein